MTVVLAVYIKQSVEKNGIQRFFLQVVLKGHLDLLNEVSRNEEGDPGPDLLATPKAT